MIVPSCTFVPMSQVTILDGGMGKELRRIGAPFRQPEWSSLALMEAPDRVVEAHRNFIDAGADVIITNNYAVVPFHHSTEFFAERGVELTDLAGRLARRSADDSGRTVRVAGSMPPLFGSYEPGSFDAVRAAPIYRDIAGALASHVDLWLGETLSCLDEMRTIVDALVRLGTTAPLWMSFSLPDRWSDAGIALRSGESLADLVDALPDSVEAVLFNCSLPEQTGPALDELHTALGSAGRTIRTGAYANAFPIERSDDYRANNFVFERREDLTAEIYADIVAGWVDGGASIVGGCCDMYPDHIAELRNRFSECAV